jgi:L-2-hydroxyglutarate oxidase
MLATPVSRGAPQPFDVVVIGGGIIGLATARAVLRAAPWCRLAVLDKEASVASHQSGRNSNVIHSGIYYPPGSLKAQFAIAGGRALATYCAERGLPYQRTGKVIVATVDDERPALAALAARGREHGLKIRPLTPGELAKREPHVRAAAAIHVASTAVTDFHAVAAAYRTDVEAAGGQVLTRAHVTGVETRGRGLSVTTADGREFRSSLLVNCAGLYSDRIARLAGDTPAAQIVPFRGEYYELVPARRELVHGLVYPVPDARFPFLGVHFTRGIDGGVHAGPNAVLALSREGYGRWSVSPTDLSELVRYRGTWAMASRYWRTGLGEYTRSLSRHAFVTALRQLVPELTTADLMPAPAGVRAQAVGRDGTLVDDFLITESRHAVHVLNAPSPAATASIPIGKHVARLVRARLSRPAAG